MRKELEEVIIEREGILEHNGELLQRVEELEEQKEKEASSSSPHETLLRQKLDSREKEIDDLRKEVSLLRDQQFRGSAEVIDTASSSRGESSRRKSVMPSDRRRSVAVGGMMGGVMGGSGGGKELKRVEMERKKVERENEELRREKERMEKVREKEENRLRNMTLEKQQLQSDKVGMERELKVIIFFSFLFFFFFFFLFLFVSFINLCHFLFF